VSWPPAGLFSCISGLGWNWDGIEGGWDGLAGNGRMDWSDGPDSNRDPCVKLGMGGWFVAWYESTGSDLIL
jgi:hypothetical protein